MPGREKVPAWKSRNGWHKPTYSKTYHFFVTDPRTVPFQRNRPGTVALCRGYSRRPFTHLLPIEKVEGRVCEPCVRRFKEEFYDILEVL